MKKIKVTFIFEPIEDKPGYYWFSKRNYQIISKEVLERVIKKYEAPTNPYSKRTALQEFFNCEELRYSINGNK